MAKRASLDLKASRYSRKAVPESSPLNVINEICWCNQCCARRGYVAGFKAAQRSQSDAAANPSAPSEPQP
jgi:hypothetical protein